MLWNLQSSKLTKNFLKEVSMIFYSLIEEIQENFYFLKILKFGGGSTVFDHRIGMFRPSLFKRCQSKAMKTATFLSAEKILKVDVRI